MPAHAARILGLAVLLAALLVPAGAASGARKFEKGFWGPATVDGKSQFPIYRDLRVTLYQTQLRWDLVAPTRPADPTNPADPAYRWPAELDFVMPEARKYRMKVLLMLIGSPEWANGGQSREWAPDPKAFADFATAAARRYGSVRHWMIWGEPTRNANFKPLTAQTIGKPLTRKQAAGPRRYARMLDASYAALKRASRRNLVIGGNSFTAGDIRPIEWVRNLKLPNGRPPRLDLYGHNPFCLRAPSLNNPPGPQGIVDFSDLPRLQRQVDRSLGRRGKRRIRLFLSEWTVPTGPDREFNFYTTPATQVRFIRAGFRIARKVRAYGLGWVHLYDEPVRPDGERNRNSGLLEADGRRKRGYFAFKRG